MIKFNVLSIAILVNIVNQKTLQEIEVFFGYNRVPLGHS
jgi:hypothetical protein